MPKSSTFPTLYDECKAVSITFRKKYGYLVPNQWKSGSVQWSRDGNKTGSITVQVNTFSKSPYIELDCRCNKVPIKYRVALISVTSNLGKGAVWYFICPRTGKRCRKLYLVDTHFYHGSAFKGCFYEKQTYSHNNRALYKSFESIFGTEKLYEQLYCQNFKKTYKGKKTARYRKLIEKLENMGEPIKEID